MATRSAYASPALDRSDVGDLTVPQPDSLLASQFRPSPNHGARAEEAQPDCLVLHYTGMADGASALAWLRNPVSQVSCHYVVDEDGTIIQLVAEERRAWHAGRSSWRGMSDINSASIGIEIVNGGHDFGLPPFPTAQITSVIALAGDVMTRHSMRPERLLAHSDIAPGRKRDPGERFPWGLLHREGLGIWVPEQTRRGPGLQPGDEGEPVAALQSDLAAFGYAVPTTRLYDEVTRVVVSAFQLRFRPSRVDGLADATTLATLAALRLPHQ